MGCCVSKASQELFIDIPRCVSTTDEWALRQKSFVNGCKLLPFTAACPASYPYQCLTRVVLGEGYVFAALWEGKGGSQAARHCVSVCHDVLLQRLEAVGDPSLALQQAFQTIDDTYLASDLPDLVKASVGATGTMLLLDVRTNKCHVARLGNSMPFTTASKGSFNTVSVEVQDLLPLSNSRKGSAAEGSTLQQPGQPWDPVAAGITHAVGIGCGKKQELRKAWLQHCQQQGMGAGGAGARSSKQPKVPRVSVECEVYVSQLSPSKDNLVIAAEGLLQVSPPKEIATLLQHFNAGDLNTVKRALCGVKQQQLELMQQQEGVQGSPAAAATAAADGARAGARGSKRKAGDAAAPAPQQQNPLAELSAPTNVASLVVHQAVSKALDRFNAAMSKQQQLEQQQAVVSSPSGRQGSIRKQQPGVGEELLQGQEDLTYEELKFLPFDVDVAAFQDPSAGKQGGVRLPDSYPVGGLSKADVHGDMGLIVIALNWPRPADAINAAAAVTPLRPGPRALSRRPEAEWRWMLLRRLIKARQAYRRDLYNKWWQLVESVQREAEAGARQAEVIAWKTKGAAVKVNLAGTMVDPETPVNFLRAHQLPAGPVRSAGARPSSSSKQQQPAHHSPGGPYGSSGSSPAVAQQVAQPSSLPDVAAKSQRSAGGGRAAGTRAAAAAAADRDWDSPASPTGSYRSNFSNSSSVRKAPVTGQGRQLPALAVETGAAAGWDTSMDLDSPTKGPDSPNKQAAAVQWSTPPVHKLKGVSDPAGANSWSTPGSAGASRGVGGASPGLAHVGSSSSSAHKSLSLRRTPASKGASPATAAAGTPEGARLSAGRQGSTRSRPGSAAVGGGATRGGSNTPGSSSRREYDLRGSARRGL